MGPLAIALIFGLISGGGLTGLIVHKWDMANYNELKAKVAMAEAEGLRKAQALREEYDAKRQAEASAWETQRQLLTSRAIAANRKVEQYVQSGANSCITFGALRLLDGEIRGVEPERLPLPTGKSNVSCAPVAPVVFYRRLLEGVSGCKVNGAQLDALIASVKGKPK